MQENGLTSNLVAKPAYCLLHEFLTASKEHCGTRLQTGACKTLLPNIEVPSVIAVMYELSNNATVKQIYY